MTQSVNEEKPLAPPLPEPDEDDGFTATPSGLSHRELLLRQSSRKGNQTQLSLNSNYNRPKFTFSSQVQKVDLIFY